MKRTTRNALVVCASIFGLMACQPNSTTKDTKPELKEVDALTGASSEKISVLNVSDQEGLTLVYDFLKTCSAYYFATVENNSPKVRPIGIVTNYDGKLWFHVGKHKPCYKQILVNPNVEIAAMDAKGRCIRIRGKAVCEDNEKLDSVVFEKFPFLQKMYTGKPGQELGNFYISSGIADVPTDSITVVVKF